MLIAGVSGGSQPKCLYRVAFHLTAGPGQTAGMESWACMAQCICFSGQIVNRCGWGRGSGRRGKTEWLGSVVWQRGRQTKKPGLAIAASGSAAAAAAGHKEQGQADLDTCLLCKRGRKGFDKREDEVMSAGHTCPLGDGSGNSHCPLGSRL